MRDLRLWHCGKPNTSEGIRVMLAMIHFAPWYRNSMKIQLPRGGSVERKVQEIAEMLEVPAQWTDDAVNHLEKVAFGNSSVHTHITPPPPPHLLTDWHFFFSC